MTYELTLSGYGWGYYLMSGSTGGIWIGNFDSEAEAIFDAETQIATNS